MRVTWWPLSISLFLLVGCGQPGAPADAGEPPDAVVDAGTPGTSGDAGEDAGHEGADDAGVDAGTESCPTALAKCDDTCVDLAADENHCGSCGVQCGSGFACVSGACECESSVCQRTLTVSRSGTGTGRITSTPNGIDCGTRCASAFLVDTTVTLTAVADPDALFAGWEGACSGASATCVVKMSDHMSVVAVFEPASHAITVLKQGNGDGTVASTPQGIDCGSGCSAQFTTGASLELIATPSDGSEFVGWGGDCSGTGPCLLAVNGPKTVTADFALRKIPVSLAMAGPGTGSISWAPIGTSCSTDCVQQVDWGTTLTLSAAVTAGSFGGWNGPCSGTGACSFTATEAVTIGAYFNPPGGTPLWMYSYDSSLLWSTWSGQPAEGRQLQIDANEDVHVVGHAGAYTGASTRMSGGYAQISADGTTVLRKRFIFQSLPPSDSYGRALALDSLGNAYATGTAGGTYLPRVQQITPANAYGWMQLDDALVAVAPNDEVVTASGGATIKRWTAGGASLVWSVPAQVAMAWMVADSSGRVLVLDGLPGTVWEAQVRRLRATDGSAELDVTLSASRNASPVSLHPKQVAVTPTGEIYVAGYTNGAGGNRGLLILLDANGNELWRDDLARIPTEGQLLTVASTPDGGAVVGGWIRRSSSVNGTIVERRYMYLSAYGPDGTPLWTWEDQVGTASAIQSIAVRGDKAWISGHAGSAAASRIVIGKIQL